MIHIEVLEDFRDRLTDGCETVTRQHPEIVAALTAAIKCMEKQVPMKPVYVPRKDNTTDYYECSSCHWGSFSDYHDDEFVPVYCDYCGQAYDWSVEPWYVERLQEQEEMRKREQP